MHAKIHAFNYSASRRLSGAHVQPCWLFFVIFKLRGSSHQPFLDHPILAIDVSQLDQRQNGATGQVSHSFKSYHFDYFSVKPIFGARYPPLSAENKNDLSDTNSMNAKNGQRFKQYETRWLFLKIHSAYFKSFSVSDVWNSDILVNNDLAHESVRCNSIACNNLRLQAAQVIQKHANNELKSVESEQSHYEKLRSQQNKTNAMQRLALQKGLF